MRSSLSSASVRQRDDGGFELRDFLFERQRRGQPITPGRRRMRGEVGLGLNAELRRAARSTACRYAAATS